MEAWQSVIYANSLFCVPGEQSIIYCGRFTGLPKTVRFNLFLSFKFVWILYAEWRIYFSVMVGSNPRRELEIKLEIFSFMLNLSAENANKNYPQLFNVFDEV